MDERDNLKLLAEALKERAELNYKDLIADDAIFMQALINTKKLIAKSNDPEIREWLIRLEAILEKLDSIRAIMLITTKELEATAQIILNKLKQ